MAETPVAVRELAAFCHRTGSIDHRFQPSPSAADGVRGHREVTGTRSGDYRAEYPLSCVREGARRRLLLRGRADGVDLAAAVVEEIKTCRIDPARMPEALSRQHLAQGRLYAAMLAAAERLPAVTVRLVWYQLDERREHVLEQRYTADELGAFLDDALARWDAWLDRLDDLRSSRDRSVRELAFPHDGYRPGQRRAAELVYRCIDRGGQLLLEAPTGIGKTVAVLYPALKALATDKHDTAVFCTARHTGRRAAEAALVRLEAGGLRCRRLTLTAKERICFSPGSACRPDACRFARGYYDKLPAARDEALALGRLDQPAIEALARRHDLCPYQFGLDMLPWCDLVIADQHYAFGPGGALGALAAERGERWTLLVDEAHNLPGRARDMYGAALDGALLARARGAARGRLRRAFAGALEALDGVTAEGREVSEGARDLTEPPPAVLAALQQLVAAAAETLLRRPGALAAPGPQQDAWFAAVGFLRAAEEWGDDYRCELSGGDARRLRLVCIDPARLLARRHGPMHASIAFSATLAPAGWMSERLGLGAGAVWHRCPSPFAPEQLRVSIEPAIDTRWRAREASRDALVERILAWTTEHPGNCLVFFPSHRYLAACRDAIAAGAQRQGRRPWVQEAAAAADGELLALLGGARNVLALCVLGGGYSEGIDLPGDQLRSVVVVGPGLPQLSRDTRLQQTWYAARGADGFACACLYPALQRVNQALGRVVRAEGDRGAALLIDPRYRQPAYRGLLAPQWDYGDADRRDDAAPRAPGRGEALS